MPPHLAPALSASDLQTRVFQAALRAPACSGQRRELITALVCISEADGVAVDPSLHDEIAALLSDTTALISGHHDRQQMRDSRNNLECALDMCGQAATCQV